jgi:site-specific recombinase XerD
MSQDVPSLAAFAADLRRQEVSARTISSYQLDLGHFWRWFAATVGDALTAGAVTPTDIRDYRSHLLNVERRQPTTVNRRLAALRRFFRWAKASGLVEELPTENVKGVTASPGAPRWLEKREVDRVVRAVELLVGKYARLAGLEGVTPRTLRHSFGKHVLDAGEDLVTVARLLGHERLETTARYTTPSHRDLEQAVAKLEQDGGSH